jgi:hypothetical protein
MPVTREVRVAPGQTVRLVEQLSVDQGSKGGGR